MRVVRVLTAVMVAGATGASLAGCEDNGRSDNDGKPAIGAIGGAAGRRTQRWYRQ